MPRPRDYTSARHLLMQVILWIIFGATLAAAAFVVHSQRVAHQIKLASQPTVLPGMDVRLPLGWRIQPTSDGSDAILTATEPGRGGRTLGIYRQSLMRPLSPVEFLGAAFNIDLRSERDPSLADLDAAITPTRFGDFPGIILGTEVSIPGHGNEGARKEIYAAAVLPSGHAVAIRVGGVGALDQGDSELVDQVARSAQIHDEPALMSAGRSILLANGIKLAPPQGFRLIENRDPNLLRRQLWYVPAPGAPHADVRWASIELIPCVFPGEPGAKAPPQARVLTMLLARDPGWRGAAVRDKGKGEFVADLPIEQRSIIFPTRAFLLTDASGQALLAILRGSGPDLDGYWSALRQSIAFPKSSPVQVLSRAGADEVRRLHQIPLDQVLGDRNEQWWLWTNLADQPRFGWSQIKWSADEPRADVQRRFRFSDQAIVSIAEAFSGSADWNRFDSSLRWTELSQGEPGFRLHQQLALRGDQLTLRAASPTKTLARWTEKAPANFIPGALLPHLIARLSNIPMMLETDTFLGQELTAPPCPMTIIVRPQSPSATMATTRPARVVTVEINGTGELSRWHIAPDGEVEWVDFAGHIRRQPSSARQVKLEFADDPAILQ